MTKCVQNGDLMINRLSALLAVTLGALLMGLASTAAIGGVAGVEVARAQSPASAAGTDTTPDPDAGLDDTPSGLLDDTGLGGPVDDQGTTGAGTDPPAGGDTGTAPAPDPDAGLDDTPAGCLDQGGLGGPIDDTGAAGGTSNDAGADTCTATGTDPGTGSTTDPEAGLDDTPVGGLDSGNLGGPIDDTNQPPAETPPSPTPDPAPAPSGPAPAPAPGTGAAGTALPPTYVVVNVPSGTPAGGGQVAPKRTTTTKHKSAKKKHKTRHKRRGARAHKHARSHRHARKHDTSGRVGLDALPRRIPLIRVREAR
jgi:hypothetical protein